MYFYITKYIIYVSRVLAYSSLIILVSCRIPFQYLPHLHTVYPILFIFYESYIHSMV
jgi:hypothetical protein